MSRFATHSTEPELDEVMEDPIVNMLMDKDGVEKETLWPLLNAIGKNNNDHSKLYKPSH